MAKLYRAAKRGDIDVADASKLGNMLRVLFSMISEGDLEKRIEALEEAQNGHR